MPKANEFDICPLGTGSNCFACVGGYCVILTDTNLSKPNYCPFYKTKQQAISDRRAAEQSLRDRGLAHLIKRYQEYR